jgi:large subunit ribosomal protein L11
MARKIKTTIKLQIPGGQATPAPPVGPALGQHGLNIAEFNQKFNEQTRDQPGVVLTVVITVYEDRTFDFKIKTPPAAYLIKQALKLEKGAKTAVREKVGKISQAQIKEIAKVKMADLNARTIEQAAKIIEGTARSMGVDVVG